MTEPRLDGCRILVVEDQYAMADELRTHLRSAGASVIGPVARLHQGLRLVGEETAIDAAVLDVNLGDSDVYPLAERLAQREIPIVFATGYDSSWVAPQFAQYPVFGKPVALSAVVNALHRAIQRDPA